MHSRFTLRSRQIALGCSLLSATGLSAGALAQQAGATPVEEITITASRAERSLADVPQTVQIIGRQQIDEQLKMSPNPSAALAKLVPGYSISNQTISGASETFRGRDLLVLVDGVPMNTPLRDVSRILALIDMNSVERIEVVAGASSLYGAGATGGTVNFITKKAAEGGPRISIDTSLRAFTANPAKSLAPQLSASISGKAPNGFDYVVVGTGRFANRTYDGAGRELSSDGMLGQGGGDRYGAGNLFAKFGYDFSPTRRFELSGSLIYLDQKPDYLTNYAPPFARPDFTKRYTGLNVLEDTKSVSARYTDSDFALGSLSLLGFYNDVKKRFNYSEFSYPYNSQVYYSFNPLSPTSPNNQTTLYSQRGGVNATIDTPLDRLLPGMKFTWGADVIHEKTWQELNNGAQVFTPLSQTTYAGFGLLTVPVTDRLTLRGGMRYEYFDLKVDSFTRPAAYAAVAAATPLGYQAFVLPALNVTGGNFTYNAPTFNIGAVFKLTETSEIYGGFSQGFALPDVGAFTRRAGLSLTFACPLARPNCLPASARVSYASIAPDAQIVNSYELGARGTAGIFKANLVGFVSTSDKGVTFDSVTNSVSQQKEAIYGVEFNGEAALTEQLTLGVAASWREGRYDSNKDGRLDSYLPNNRIGSPLRGMMFASYRFLNGVQVRVEGEAFAGRNQPIDLVGTRYELKSGGVMNVAVSAPFQGGEVYASVNNIFDTNYQNPTATSVRNLPVYSWGRTMTVGFRKTF